MRLGLDVGGTKTDVVAVDDLGDILAQRRLSTGWGPQGVVDTIVAAVEAVATDAACAGYGVESVGIGMPGQAVPGTTRMLHAVNLGVADLDVAAAVSPRLDGVTVRVENDVKAAALGAYARHAVDGAGTTAYLNLGTGIAAGIVANGVLWRGRRGTAGEVGHISVDPDGPRCRCGQRGCIEALAGGGALAERWGRGGALPIRDVFDAAENGDATALVLREQLSTGVASAIRILVLTTDADVVVLGGGVSALGDRLLTEVYRDLARSAEASAFMNSLNLGDRVRVLPQGSAVAAVGAALVGAGLGDTAYDREVSLNG